MSEAASRSQIARLLDTIQEQSSQIEEQVQISKTELIRQISDRVAHTSHSAGTASDLHDLLKRVREGAAQLEADVRFRNVGTVQHVGQGVATISGLPDAITNEVVEFPTGVRGLILNLERDRCDVILLGSDVGIQGGDMVIGTGERLRVPVGSSMLKNIVNPLGEPLNGGHTIDATEFRYLERRAPGIVERAPVNEPLHTGWKIIDALVPIGRGQRELIVGDRQTGKTTLAIDMILSQRDRDITCVYVAIGQKKSTTLGVIETLREHGAMEYTVVVVSSPDDPPALRYLAPYTGCTLAEHFVYGGHDTLVVYDDLTKHADAYRELSLLLRRPPGREAYPGDIFYLHSRLLERACKLNDEFGGGSMTALPIVEMQRGNIASYIPTNLISITDGQIVLDTGLFNRRIKPAVDIGRSVSRVGGSAQTPAMRSVVRDLRLELSQYEEVARFARFGTDVDETTHRQIERGKRLQTVLIHLA
jgi:F-type H+-transporting ATPase subunit alpha